MIALRDDNVCIIYHNQQEIALLHQFDVSAAGPGHELRGLGGDRVQL